MSSDNKLDKTGLAYLWSKMTAYVQEIVGYVPELFIQIGNTPLGTTAATISGAIREIGDRVGNTVMGTTAATVTGAIKELVDKIGNAEMGTEAVTITGAIAEHEQDISDLNNNIVDTIFASTDTSKYTLNNVRLVRCGYIYILLGEVKCLSPVVSNRVPIVDSGMPNIFSGQIFIPSWGASNASKDSLGVQFNNQGIFLSYGTANGFYELCIPLMSPTNIL